MEIGELVNKALSEIDTAYHYEKSKQDWDRYGKEPNGRDRFYSKRRLLVGKLLLEACPTLGSIQQTKHFASLSKARAKKAESVVEQVAEIAEKALCDDLSKNELIRSLERIIKECGFSD